MHLTNTDITPCTCECRREELAHFGDLRWDEHQSNVTLQRAISGETFTKTDWSMIFRENHPFDGALMLSITHI